jgi:hypothetical protein
MTTWSYDPWRERPAVAWGACVTAVGLCVLVLMWRESFLVSVALCLYCLAALSPALMPVECGFDADGPARRGWLGWERRRWPEVRRIEALPAGALVSPYPQRHFLDSARAMVLPMPSRQRAELMALLEGEWRRHGG